MNLGHLSNGKEMSYKSYQQMPLEETEEYQATMKKSVVFTKKNWSIKNKINLTPSKKSDWAKGLSDQFICKKLCV